MPYSTSFICYFKEELLPDYTGFLYKITGQLSCSNIRISFTSANEPGSNIQSHNVMSTNSKLYYCQVLSYSVYCPPPLLPIKLCEMSGQKPPYKINRFSRISLKEKQILLTHNWRTFIPCPI
jgi:hypothetical protein